MGCPCCRDEPSSINSCKSIKDLIEFTRINLFNRAFVEQYEIDTYLNDKNIIPKHVNINLVNDADLTQRRNYLIEYKNALKTAIDILSQNKDLINFEHAQTQIEKFNQAYDLHEDCENILENIINKLNILVNNAKNYYYDCEITNENNLINDSSSSSTSSISSQSIGPKIFININFANKKYIFQIKKEYDLNKVLYRFKKQNKNLKPKGKFTYRGDEIDDLSKTCEYLGINEGDNLYLV